MLGAALSPARLQGARIDLSVEFLCAEARDLVCFAALDILL